MTTGSPPARLRPATHYAVAWIIPVLFLVPVLWTVLRSVQCLIGGSMTDDGHTEVVVAVAGDGMVAEGGGEPVELLFGQQDVVGCDVFFKVSDAFGAWDR